ncbi:MAG: SDR family oxidoreductase [Acidimicrobiales bacterium]
MSSGPTAIVTGANSGIGLETARALARADFHTVLVCRDEERAAAAKADIDASVPGGSTEIVLCDLALQSDIRRAVTDITAGTESLDLLVNNAGITIRSRAETDEGIDVMLAVNHLAPFLLTDLVLPMLEAAPAARIVNLSSDAHKLAKLDLDDLQATRGYGLLGWPRYCETKLMNVLFTRELARRLTHTDIVANAVHPGAVRTNLGAPPAVLRAVLGLVLKSPEEGAHTTLAAALDPSYADVTGSYFVKEKPADDQLSNAARNDRAAERLWKLSAELVDLVADDSSAS